MADVTKKYVDYAGLQEYDTLIKGKVLSDAAQAAADAVDALDTAEFALATETDGVVTISGIKEENGQIAKGTDTTKDVTFAKVATTGAAEDLSYDPTTSGLTATDIQGAVDEVAAASAGGVNSKTIWGHDESAGQSEYAKVYKIYQGENDYVPDRTDGKENPVLKLTINLPKDKALQGAGIVDIVFKASDSTLHEGSESGADVTALIVGEGTATAANAGKYLKMVMQNVDNPLYVNLQTFVDVYTVASGASEIQLALNDHEFSASVVKIDGSKIVYKDETSAGAGDGETVKAALTRLDGADTVVGSVAKKIKDAVGALDTPSNVVMAAEAPVTGAVTFTAAIQEADGIVSAASGDNVVFTPVTSAEIGALFTPAP